MYKEQELSDLIGNSGHKTDVAVSVSGIARGVQESTRLKYDPPDLRRYIAFLQSLNDPKVVLKFLGEIKDENFPYAMAMLLASSQGNMSIKIKGLYRPTDGAILAHLVTMGNYSFSTYGK